MAVAGSTAVACDAEPVVPRGDDVWRDLLGGDRYQLARSIAQRCQDDLHTAATRVWAAQECLTKVGAGFDSPLMFGRATREDWILLTTGPLNIATWASPAGDVGQRLVFAVLGPAQT